MPITLKKDEWKVKDPSSGNYRGTAILSTTLPEDAAQIIEDTQNALDAEEVRAGQIINDAQNSVDGIEAQSSLIQQKVANAVLNGNNYELIDTAVESWLDAHPEATTTVEDHSLTYNKLVNGTLGFFTPEMFGAVGDGETDDSESIQEMFDRGGIFVFKKDTTYAIGQSLNLYSNSIIIGNNAKLKAIDYIRILKIPTKNHDIVITDLNFEGINSFYSSQQSACLEIQRTNSNSAEYEDAYNITIKGCKFDKGKCGIIASKATMIIIENCEFSDFCVQPDVSSGGYGILLQSSYRVFITSCRFYKHRYGRHDVYISELPQEEDYTSNYCKDIHISKCFIDHSEAIRDNPATDPDTASGSTNSISLRNPTDVYIEDNYAYNVTCFVRTNSTSNPHRACDNIFIKNNIIDSPIYAPKDTLPSESRSVFNCAGTSNYVGTWIIEGNIFENCNDTNNVMCIIDVSYGKFIIKNNRIYGNGYAISVIYAPCEVMIDGHESEQYGNSCFEIRAIDTEDTYVINGYIRNVVSPNSNTLIRWTSDNTVAPLSFFEIKELKFTPSSITPPSGAVSIPATIAINSNRYEISMPHVISNTIRMASIIIQDYNNYKTWVRMYDDYGNVIRFYLYNDSDSTLNTSAQGKILLM